MTTATVGENPPTTVYPRGAEAIIDHIERRDSSRAVKRRIRKGYRHPSLDLQVRAERTRDEANLLLQARRAGIFVPVVYDVDRAHATIVMEAIVGAPLREILPADSDAMACKRLQILGSIVARLHAAGMTHGDLTTSNVIVQADTEQLVLIDFGLGQFTQEVEARGVDLHLLEEALASTEERAEKLLGAFLAGYGGWNGAAAAMRRLEDIRARGRYR